MTQKNLNLPVQVENLISKLLDKKEDIYTRNNYRASLDTIRVEVEKALKVFDKETLPKIGMKTK